jgi:hypothetical protein
MGEPALNKYDDENHGMPAKKPHLEAIEGGGEESGPPRGDLKSVPQEDLADAESSGSQPEATKADEAEKTDIEPQEGKGSWRTNVGRAKSNVSMAKKLGIAGGVAGVLAVALIALFSFLLPFKLTHIVESIEQRVGQVPQYAVEHRLEYYMNRYLIIRTLEATGGYDFREGGSDRNKFLYLGDGFWKTMYTNWNGAKLDKVLTEKYNVKLRATQNPDFYRNNPKEIANHFEFEDLGVGQGSGQSNRVLSRTEARQLIKEFAQTETKSRQVFKRYNMRKVMKRYHGVGNWKPFEKQRDETANKYYEKKRAFQKRLINETVGRLSERYALYMDCLLGADSSKACRDKLKKADPNTNLPSGEKEDDGTKSAAESVDANIDNPNPDETPKSFSRKIMSQVQEFGLKKILASLAAGIGIIDTLNHIYNSVDSGIINQVIYDKNAQQYLAYSAPFLSAADQIRAGNNSFDVEDVRVAHEVLNDYDNSPVYQAGSGTAGTVSAASQISRDCNDDSSDGNETLLEPGETVCEEKRLIQDKTKFVESPGWELLGTILAPYRNTIGGIIKGATDALGSIADAIGLNDVISGLASFFKLDQAAASIFGFLLGRIAGPVVSGAEADGDAYDSLYAGIAVAQSSVGGEVGVAKEDTIGGAYLSDQQTAMIQQAQLQEYYDELESESFFVRMFAPDIKESLTGQIAMNTPNDIAGAGQQAASFIGSFGNIFSFISKLFAPKVHAQNMAYSNPFHVLNMGFPVDHEIFAANGGEGMAPDEIKAKYQCDLPVGQRPQNSGDSAFGRPDNLPFEVPVIPDPCLLEEATIDASTRYFTGTFDEGIDGSTGATSAGSTSATGIVGDPFSSSDTVPCAAGTQDLGIHDGYSDGALIKLRLCAIPNIASGSSESTPGTSYYIQGSDGKAIVSSRVSGAVFAMADAAASAGVTLSASSSFRTMTHQQALWNANSNPTYVAPPGQSNHQTGVAIDFRSGSVKGGATCELRAGAPGNSMWDWLFANAERFGYKQYSAESWHWDPSLSASRCDSSQPARITVNSRAPL